MGLTPDRSPGPRTEEKITLVDDGYTADVPGDMVYDEATGAFVFKDDTGSFDPRTGGGISEAQHKALRQLIHFIDDGPAEGFTSGAYREVAGTVFPTAIVWWESSSKLKKIVERLMTWTGSKLTTDQWKIYDTDGSTVLATVTDAINYSGAFETNRTRTIA